MKLEEINIKIEKLGNIIIYSYNGFILACTDKGYSDIIYFFPLSVNKDILEKNKNLLTTYLDFIRSMRKCLGYTHSPKYDLEIKETNKTYEYCIEFELIEKISNLPSNLNITIEPELSISLKDFAYMILKEIPLLDKKFNLDYYYDTGEKLTMNTLSIDIDNYISIPIDHLNYWKISVTHTEYEKDIKDVVNILKHFLEMYDKNRFRKTIIYLTKDF